MTTSLREMKLATSPSCRSSLLVRHRGGRLRGVTHHRHRRSWPDALRTFGNHEVTGGDSATDLDFTDAPHPHLHFHQVDFAVGYPKHERILSLWDDRLLRHPDGLLAHGELQLYAPEHAGPQLEIGVRHAGANQ